MHRSIQNCMLIHVNIFVSKRKSHRHIIKALPDVQEDSIELSKAVEQVTFRVDFNLCSNQYDKEQNNFHGDSPHRLTKYECVLGKSR